MIVKSSIPIIVCIGSLAGCATGQATLTVHSQPEGAYITEVGTGTAFGNAPVVVAYNSKGLGQVRVGNCYFVNGLQAQWASGANASLEKVKLCGSPTAAYNITFARDPTQPGLEKDMQFGLQVQSVRAQQQQAQASEDAAALAAFSIITTPTTVKCTSQQVGATVQTVCR